MAVAHRRGHPRVLAGHALSAPDRMQADTFDPHHTTALDHALDLAEQALWLTSPNPRVGCVLTDAGGRVLGRGHTQRVGGPHAEVMALRDAQARGHALQGATAWVTLEPCAHQGRTGPCCDALIHAGVARVVALLTDPNPRVAGQGFARLRAAGVQVEVLEDSAQAERAREQNIGFLHRMRHGLPWTRMKMAASVDGQTALADGQSQWITQAQARADGHAWRARACAVLTGIGTVLQDNPRLDVRHAPTPRQPHLVVVDSRLELPLEAALLGTRDAQRQIWVYAAQAGAPGRRAALAERGVEVIDCPGPGGKVDLRAMLQDLARREINELHIEAGHRLNGSFMREALVDEWLLYLAPRFMGPGQGLAHLPALTGIDPWPEHLALRFHEVSPVGPDLRLRLRRR